MAWDRNRHRVCGACTRNCANCRRTPDCLCHLRIRARFAEAYGLQIRPHSMLKCRCSYIKREGRRLLVARNLAHYLFSESSQAVIIAAANREWEFLFESLL